MATTPVDDRISRIGHEIYETQLRDTVETEENIGRLISIDINTGDYEIGDDLIPTVRLLRQRRRRPKFGPSGSVMMPSTLLVEVGTE